MQMKRDELQNIISNFTSMSEFMNRKNSRAGGKNAVNIGNHKYRESREIAELISKIYHDNLFVRELRKVLQVEEVITNSANKKRFLKRWEGKEVKTVHDKFGTSPFPFEIHLNSEFMPQYTLPSLKLSARFPFIYDGVYVVVEVGYNGTQNLIFTRAFVTRFYEDAKIYCKDNGKNIIYVWESGEFMVIEDTEVISCIHTAVMDIAPEEMFSKEVHGEARKELSLHSSEQDREIKLEFREKFKAFRSWGAGIAEAGPMSVAIQGQIESMAHLVTPITYKMMRFLARVSETFIYEYVDYIFESCRFEGTLHKASLYANIKQLFNGLMNGMPSEVTSKVIQYIIEDKQFSLAKFFLIHPGDYNRAEHAWKNYILSNSETVQDGKTDGKSTIRPGDLVIMKANGEIAKASPRTRDTEVVGVVTTTHLDENGDMVAAVRF